MHTHIHISIYYIIVNIINTYVYVFINTTHNEVEIVKRVSSTSGLPHRNTTMFEHLAVQPIIRCTPHTQLRNQSSDTYIYIYMNVLYIYDNNHAIDKSCVCGLMWLQAWTASLCRTHMTGSRMCVCNICTAHNMVEP
jgi:hypothetical protein